MCRIRPLIVLFSICGLVEGTASAAESGIRILPAELHLDGPKATHRLLVESVSAGTLTGMVSSGVTWTSSNESVVIVTDGVAIPVGNGVATLTATVADEQSSIEVHVSNLDAEFQWTFRNHVEPVLAKAGCNSGACHGALAGKGGFRLSLNGYDPDSDHFNITQQQRSRRVELSEPGRSLFLTKPTAAVPHKGGRRFGTDTLNYKVLSEWIAYGAEGPRAEDARLVELRVLPGDVTLLKEAGQPLIAQAVYSDGRVEDVTHWAKFTSTDQSVVSVDENGEVTVIGPGEAAVTAWFSSRLAFSRITVPWDHDVSPVEYITAARRNFIDELVIDQLRRLNLKPSPRADDATFIRRAFLDTIGVLPTADEVRQFLNNPSPDKRDTLIDALLARPEFVDYWTYRWSDLLLINGRRLRPDAVKAYYTWVRGHVEANTPWDEFVRQIVTAQGSSMENGATNFYALHQSPEDMAENVSQAFLGLSIGCAKCHNHPLEKWTNDQYYSFANLFSRVRAKGWGGDPRNGDGKRTLFVVASGELVQPRTGQPQPPTPLDGTPLEFDDPTDRRIKLAEWLTSPDNELFARSITNRVWKAYMGVGLVEQVDDMRISNPASNEALLAATSSYLVDHAYDLKALMKLILQSETYQRSSQPLPQNLEEGKFNSRYYPRRLMAEVLLDAVSNVTAVPTKFTHIAFDGADRQETSFYAEGTRAVQLYDSSVESYFLKTFGRNQRNITCECERSDEPSMVQVLHISNGSTMNDKLTSESGRVTAWKAAESDDATLVDEIYLTALSRYPTDSERAQLVEILTQSKRDRETLEDLVWGILSSREFLFNH